MLINSFISIDGVLKRYFGGWKKKIEQIDFAHWDEGNLKRFLTESVFLLVLENKNSIETRTLGFPNSLVTGVAHFGVLFLTLYNLILFVVNFAV